MGRNIKAVICLFSIELLCSIVAPVYAAPQAEVVPQTCSYKKQSYEIGATWKDAEKCAVLECVLSEKGRLDVKVYKPVCKPLPIGCPFMFIHKKDCCLQCAYQVPTNAVIQLQSLDIKDEWTEEYYRNHECNRKCKKKDAMTCYYRFEIESYQSLSRACYDCPNNSTDCKRPHCIPTDGITRSVTVANRMMPGPAIEVCENDIIVVDVYNGMLSETTTIHWHGMQQKDTPYMDGVPHVTQCPITPSSTFRYTFEATEVGTNWWHSHIGVQRGDGLLGALIVRQRKQKNAHHKLYDYDLSEHKMILQDWVHEDALPVFTANQFSDGSNQPRNLLINGLGQYYAEIWKEGRAHYAKQANRSFGENIVQTIFENENLDEMPHTVYNVEKGQRYRFRIINGVFLNCPIEVSVDSHTLTVISSDGLDLEPIVAGSVITYPGERWDFVLHANQKVDNYWIRLKGLSFCDARFNSAFQVAILRYEGANDAEPDETLGWSHEATGAKINTLSSAHGYTTADLRSLSEVDLPGLEEDVLEAEPDVKLFLNFGVYSKNNDIVHPHYYNYNNSLKGKVPSPQFHFITLKRPAFSMLSQRDKYDDSEFCNATTLAEDGYDCTKEFCYCLHTLQVPHNAIVEIIYINEDSFNSSHPIHLHGHAFRVLGVQQFGKTNLATIKELDAQGKLIRNFDRPLIKDTLSVPSGGYAVVRFRAYNPGYWFMHCHIEFHAEEGMALILKVGENNEMLPVPKHFPTCSDFMPEIPEPTKNKKKHKD